MNIDRDILLIDALQGRDMKDVDPYFFEKHKNEASIVFTERLKKNLAWVIRKLWLEEFPHLHLKDVRCDDVVEVLQSHPDITGLDEARSILWRKSIKKDRTP